MFRDTAYEGFRQSKASLSYLTSNPESKEDIQTEAASNQAWEPPEDWDPTIPIYEDFEK